MKTQDPYFVFCLMVWRKLCSTQRRGYRSHRHGAADHSTRYACQPGARLKPYLYAGPFRRAPAKFKDLPAPDMILITIFMAIILIAAPGCCQDG